MASEPIGLSYGSGREKVKQRKFLDALLTFYDSRCRIPYIRSSRQKRLAEGRFYFPISTSPRCLSLPGFTPDCDAIYPAHPQEIINYLSKKYGNVETDIF